MPARIGQEAEQYQNGIVLVLEPPTGARSKPPGLEPSLRDGGGPGGAVHDQASGRGRLLEYEGLRFRAECKLAGKRYGHPFGVDVAFGDPILGEPEVVVAEDVLAFASIAPPTLRLYPIETHVAEKLHAYTMPRPRPNSRVKDLPTSRGLRAYLSRLLNLCAVRGQAVL